MFQCVLSTLLMWNQFYQLSIKPTKRKVIQEILIGLKKLFYLHRRGIQRAKIQRAKTATEPAAAILCLTVSPDQANVKLGGKWRGVQRWTPLNLTKEYRQTLRNHKTAMSITLWPSRKCLRSWLLRKRQGSGWKSNIFFWKLNLHREEHTVLYINTDLFIFFDCTWITQRSGSDMFSFSPWTKPGVFCVFVPGYCISNANLQHDNYFKHFSI